MAKKRHLAVRLIIILAAVLLTVYFVRQEPNHSADTIGLYINVKSEDNFVGRVYYVTQDQGESAAYSETQSVPASYGTPGKVLTMGYGLPANTCRIRFDPAETDQADIEISSIRLQLGDMLLKEFTLDDVKASDVTIQKSGSGWMLTTKSADSRIELGSVDASSTLKTLNKVHRRGDLAKKIAIIVFVDLIALLVVLKWDRLTEIPGDVIHSRKLIFQLGKNDFRTRFAGSYLGIFWAFVQPMITIFVYWFVFEKALRVGTQSTKAGISVPYVLWLMAGLIPWFFFSEAYSSGTNALLEYSYLVKKVVFKIDILPLVKVVSSLFVHLFFIVFIVVCFAIGGFYPTPYMIQMLYYSLAMIILVSAQVYFSAAIVVFFRDLSQIINIIMQIGVWFTPIMWNIDAMNLSRPVTFILELNPMYYIVMGYRDALINNVWFWTHPTLTAYFWALVVLLFVIGTTVFRRLSVHFADVL
ncbi:MAG: ABC transporter permease [Bilifractor sp.]|jgi:teichoic acid transport system permease protein